MGPGEGKPVLPNLKRGVLWVEVWKDEINGKGESARSPPRSFCQSLVETPGGGVRGALRLFRRYYGFV